MAHRHWLLLALLGCSSPAERVSFELTLTNVAEPSRYAYEVGFSPGWLRASTTRPLFVEGEPASDALELLVEEGDPIELARGEDGVPIPPEYGASYDRTGLAPGESWTATFEAREGESLTFACMFGASNDTFVGLTLDPFAREGDVTSAARFYDAGTEVNEPVGAGENQPGSGAGGDEETSVIGPPPADIPALPDVLRVELTRTP